MRHFLVNSTIYMFGYSYEFHNGIVDELPAPEPVGYFITEELAIEGACHELGSDGSITFIRSFQDGRCKCYHTLNRINSTVYIYTWELQNTAKYEVSKGATP